ncbi:MAG TPA: DUF5681 domain-containing protein [Roseiarcus sp.]
MGRLSEQLERRENGQRRAHRAGWRLRNRQGPTAEGVSLEEGAERQSRSQAGRPPKDSELIERLFRRAVAVIEGGEKVRKTGFEIIFAQLMAKESAGDRRAATTRDRYQRFAFAHLGPDGVLLRYAETEFTRAFSADWMRGRESKGQGDAEPGSSQAPVDVGEEVAEALKAMRP